MRQNDKSIYDGEQVWLSVYFETTKYLTRQQIIDHPEWCRRYSVRQFCKNKSDAKNRIAYFKRKYGNVIGTMIKMKSERKY